MQFTERLANLIERRATLAQLGYDLGEVRCTDDQSHQHLHNPIGSLLVVEQA